MNRSPLTNLENSGRFCFKLSNNSSKNGFAIACPGQRSRHQASVKYSSALNIGSRLKTKTSKNSKSKKKSNSSLKLADGKSKGSQNRSPAPSNDSHTTSVTSKLTSLENSQFSYRPKKVSSKSRKNYDSGSSLDSKKLSNSKISKRETGKLKIVSFIGKYIQNNAEVKIDQDYEETINNLKDFLGYLEDKNIINGQQLEDKKEVNNLIKDLMKLDLSKFHSMRDKEKKKGSRNINVSVNRSNSTAKQYSQNSSINGRKTQSVSSKNIYRVQGGHANQNSEDFKSSRRLSY